MPEHVFVNEAAKLLGVLPGVLSDLFYRRRLGPDDGYPIMGGRRVIPLSRLPDLANALAARKSKRKAVAVG
jgi:hypothetical protein